MGSIKEDIVFFPKQKQKKRLKVLVFWLRRQMMRVYALITHAHTAKDPLGSSYPILRSGCGPGPVVAALKPPGGGAEGRGLGIKACPAGVTTASLA